MGVQPNLVLGAVGAVVFLFTGSLIVTNWRSLTDTRDWVVTLEMPTPTFSFPARGGTIAQGGTVQQSYTVPHHNITHFYVHVTWSEGGGPLSAQHDVTLKVTTPDGTAFTAGPSRGGTPGLTIERDLNAMPRGSSFSATGGGADAEFKKRYPDHAETAGLWMITISASGSGSITYQNLQFSGQYYVAYYREAPELTR